MVTGGSGLLGTGLKAISHEYPKREVGFFSSKECDLTKLDDTLRFVESKSPNAILHVAAVSGGIQFSTKYPTTLLRDNVLEAARIHAIKKTVMALSTGMYPASVRNPIRKEYIHDGYPHESNWGSTVSFAVLE